MGNLSLNKRFNWSGIRQKYASMMARHKVELTVTCLALPNDGANVVTQFGLGAISHYGMADSNGGAYKRRAVCGDEQRLV